MDPNAHRPLGNVFAESVHIRGLELGEMTRGSGGRGRRPDVSISRVGEGGGEAGPGGPRDLPDVETSPASPGFVNRQVSEDRSESSSVPLFLGHPPSESFSVPRFLGHPSIERSRSPQPSRYTPTEADIEAEAEADMQIEESRARRMNLLVTDPQLGVEKVSGVTSFAFSGAFAQMTEDEDTSTTEITIGRDPFRQKRS
jgi:hypothetical protein